MSLHPQSDHRGEPISRLSGHALIGICGGPIARRFFRRPRSGNLQVRPGPGSGARSASAASAVEIARWSGGVQSIKRQPLL